jgi:Domain of unknown function (DUF222)
MRSRPLCRDHGVDARSQELAANMERRQREVTRLEAVMIAEVGEFDGAQAWRGDGALSMVSWLVARTHVGAARARLLVEAGAALGQLPKLSAALSAGDITLDVLAPLLPVATPANDAELAQEALHWTPREARECAATIKGTRDREARREIRNRYVRFDDEHCRLWGQLSKDAYATVKSALVGRARRYDHPSSFDDAYDSFENRCADALTEICTERGKRAGGCGGSSSGGCGGGFGGTATTMVVHTDLALLLQGDGYGYASIQGVGPISAETARRLACNANITISFEHPDGTCIDQRPLRRDPTPAQRIEIARRDNGCRMPGCPCRNVTDVHHVVWASRQGPTVTSNLLTLCVAHHSRVHELGWQLDGDANSQVTFTSPTGKTYVSTPSPGWRQTFRQRK